MTLRTTIATDAYTVFTSTDDFAEEVTYIPHQYFEAATPTNRTINAVVIREDLTAYGEDGSEANSPVWQVHVANDSTYGISSTELDLGGDAISLPPRDGQSAETRYITRLLLQDNGMLVLECR